MSGPESGLGSAKPDDRLLDEFLAGDSEMTRLYRETRAIAAPPPLDPPVLKIAQDELGRPRIVAAGATPKSPLLRWRLPLAAAATVVLSVSVLVNLQSDPELRPQAFEIKAAESVVPRNLDETLPPPVAAEALAASPASIPEPLPATPPPVIAEELRQDAMPQPEPQRPAAKLAKPPSASAPVPKKKVSAPPPPPAESEARARTAEKAETAGAAMRQQSDARVNFYAAQSEPSALDTAEQKTLEPNAWLARIATLLDEQKLEQASQECAAFQQRYPDHPMPEPLRACLPEPATAVPQN